MMKLTKTTKREAKQLYRICLVNGLLDEIRVRQVVGNLVATGNRAGLPILAYFLRLVKLDWARHTATIEGAIPLSDDYLTVLQTGLASRYGPGLNTVYFQRPALIGGMRIQVGWDVYDGSVRARLDALEKSIG